jgi:hypothetical protein
MMNPGIIRDRLDRLSGRIRDLEQDLSGEICRERTGYVPICHELVEASEAVERAIALLDENYRELQ